MGAQEQNSICGLGEDDPLRVLLEGTATVTGERFFEALVENLSSALNTKCAWITEYLEDVRRLRALAFWVDGQLVPDFKVDIEDTPCEAVIDKAQLVHYPDNIRDLFPSTLKLNELGAVSYMGVPLMDLNGTILGHLAVIDSRPMPEDPKSVALFQIFAVRAAAELQRIRAESEVKDREEKHSRLVDSAMDAIIELDKDLNIVMLNPAAQTVFNFRLDEHVNSSFLQFLSTESHQKITELTQELNERPEGSKYLWIPGGLRARVSDGDEFTAEATLSQFELRRRTFYTLILRNVNERIEAERKIRSLREEAAYLKEEIKAMDDFEEIIGQSREIKQVLHDINQVADTDRLAS